MVEQLVGFWMGLVLRIQLLDCGSTSGRLPILMLFAHQSLYESPRWVKLKSPMIQEIIKLPPPCVFNFPKQTPVPNLFPHPFLVHIFAPYRFPLSILQFYQKFYPLSGRVTSAGLSSLWRSRALPSTAVQMHRLRSTPF